MLGIIKCKIGWMRKCILCVRSGNFNETCKQRRLRAASSAEMETKKKIETIEHRIRASWDREAGTPT